MERIKRNIMSELGRSRYTSWVLNLMSIIMVVGVGILLYWEFADYDILEPQPGNYSLDKEVYTNGETLNIHFKICKKKNIRERIIGRFVDGVIFSTPDLQSNFDVQCYDTFITKASIPDTLPAGNYVYEEQVIYKVNPIREVSYTFTTPRFEVVNERDCD
jgi:hypothetical protein